jgi:hypothetical protein
MHLRIGRKKMIKNILIIILMALTFISCDNDSQRKSDFKRKVMHSKLVFPYNENYGLFFTENGDNLQFRSSEEQDMHFSFYKLIGEKQESIGIYTNDGEYYFIISVIDGEFGGEVLSAYMKNINIKSYKDKFDVSDYEPVFYDKNIVANIITNEPPTIVENKQEIAFDKKSNNFRVYGTGFNGIFEYGEGPEEHSLDVYLMENAFFGIMDWSYYGTGYYSINLKDNTYAYGGDTYKFGSNKKIADAINKLESCLKIIHRQDGNTKQIKMAKDILLKAREKVKRFDSDN